MSIKSTNTSISSGVPATAPSGGGGITQLTGDVTAGPGSGSVVATIASAILSLFLRVANNLSDLNNAATARTNLGLGTLATQSGTFSGTSSGTNTGDQTITLTSDVTGTGTGSFATTIAAGAVTEAKQTLADNTTLDVSTSKHGYVPKATNVGKSFLDTGLWGYDPLFTRVTGSNVTRTAQTLADITGLSLALVANATYEFEAVLEVSSSSTAGNQYGVQFSAAGATVESQIMGGTSATAMLSARISALNTAASAMCLVAGSVGVRIQGIITVGANAGNLTIQHLKVTSGTATVLINSFLRAQRIA